MKKYEVEVQVTCNGMITVQANDLIEAKSLAKQMAVGYITTPYDFDIMNTNVISAVEVE